MRGSALGTIVIGVGLALLAVFAVSALSLQHLQGATAFQHRQQARLLAESAIHWGIDRLHSNRAFARTPLPGDRYTFTSADGGTGDITFVPGGPIPHSTNNLGNEGGSVAGHRRAVPGRCAHLIGVGRYRGTQVVVEALIHMPLFPYGVIARRSFSATGPFTLGAVGSGTDGMPEFGAREFQMGRMVSNGDVLLRDGTLVHGDVKVVNTLTLEGSARIDGQIDNPADELMPLAATIDITSRDPGPAVPSRYTPPTPINGRIRLTSPPPINGDVVLANGLLYVQGNLTINGHVSGHGLILVTGNLTIKGSSNLSAGMATALAAKGDIHLEGDAGRRLSIQGVVYADGKITMTRTTVLGAVAGNEVEVEDGDIVGVPGGTRISVGGGGTSVPSGNSPITVNPPGGFKVRPYLRNDLTPAERATIEAAMVPYMDPNLADPTAMFAILHSTMEPMVFTVDTRTSSAVARSIADVTRLTGYRPGDAEAAGWLASVYLLNVTLDTGGGGTPTPLIEFDLGTELFGNQPPMEVILWQDRP